MVRIKKKILKKSNNQNPRKKAESSKKFNLRRENPAKIKVKILKLKFYFSVKHFYGTCTELVFADR